MLKAGKPMFLLIVDDNQQMRRLIRSVVGDLAESIAECCDGSLALAAYAEHCPDWVLMDIKMQQMDGITATREIRASYPMAHVCIVTDYEDVELRQAATEAGAEGYVVKGDLLVLRQMLAAAA
jgi:NarL family two-component system response regulator LiaR